MEEEEAADQDREEDEGAWKVLSHLAGCSRVEASESTERARRRAGVERWCEWWSAVADEQRAARRWAADELARQQSTYRNVTSRGTAESGRATG